MNLPLDSPCIKTCQIHPRSGLCIGCLRSLDEIAGWSSFSPLERTRILEDLPRRSAVPQENA